MPRRKWKPLSPMILAEYLDKYPCPEECPARKRIEELFGVLSYDIVEERKAGKVVELSKQTVNGWWMRKFISIFVSNIADAIRNKDIEEWPFLLQQYNSDKAKFMGTVFGCVHDLCFNLEYVRRITDSKWCYCNEADEPRVYYSYLGVCPYCITKTDNPNNCSITEPGKDGRYFGNKIKSHYVGRIGERVITFILDLITKSQSRDATTGMVFDDQHDIDSIFFFEGKAILSQIKSSPLILLPVVAELNAPIITDISDETGQTVQAEKHSLVGFTASDHELSLYVPLQDKFIPIGPRKGKLFPYTTFVSQMDTNQTLCLLDNWAKIFESFSIPKRLRTGDDVKQAWLTAGWGAPIDDNKSKAGLARSDNTMKGTYASLKYSAYYAQECVRSTMHSALVSNLDPAHQYEEYLQKIHDVKWGHQRNFKPFAPTRKDIQNENETVDSSVPYEIIRSDELAFLFDGIFTFNRQILNEPTVKRVWDLAGFSNNLVAHNIDNLLREMAEVPKKAQSE